MIYYDAVETAHDVEPVDVFTPDQLQFLFNLEFKEYDLPKSEWSIDWDSDLTIAQWASLLPVDAATATNEVVPDEEEETVADDHPMPQDNFTDISTALMTLGAVDHLLIA